MQIKSIYMELHSGRPARCVQGVPLSWTGTSTPSCLLRGLEWVLVSLGQFSACKRKATFPLFFCSRTLLMRLARKLKKDPLYFGLSPEGRLSFPPRSYLWQCHSCYMKPAIINHLSASQITQLDNGSLLTPVLLLFSSNLSQWCCGSESYNWHRRNCSATTFPGNDPK